MSLRPLALAATLAATAAFSALGCNSLLGDFTVGNVGDGGPHDGALPDGGLPDAKPHDAAVDGDAQPPPPPPHGKPGFDLTAGGNSSKSASYALIGAVGEGPGGNGVSKSTKYTLKGGIVAGTQ
jgi:hypothetical protein